MPALKRVGCEESKSSIACSVPVSTLAAAQCCSYQLQESVPLGLLGRKTVWACLDVKGVKGKGVDGDRA